MSSIAARKELDMCGSTVKGMMGLLVLGSVAACGGQAEDLEVASLRGALTSRHHPEFSRKLSNIPAYRVNERALTRESVCGARSLQHVNSFTATSGISKDFVSQHKGAVGALTSSPVGSKYCSGTLIGPNIFLTASHCVGSDTVGQYVAFNYERAAGRTDLLRQEFVRISSVAVEGALSGMDYAVLVLDGLPGLTYGWTVPLAEDPGVGKRLVVIQHPNGEPKQIDLGTLAGFDGEYMTYADLDTLPGSSGSGVLDEYGRLVGIHTNGGCSAAGGTNSGVRMEKVVMTTP